jgi:hypothetical protein
VTVPLPEPDPDTIVIHESLDRAVQVQPDATYTVNEPVPPEAVVVAEVDDSVVVHAEPSCVTVKVVPLTVIEPVRELTLGFLVTV